MISHLPGLFPECRVKLRMATNGDKGSHKLLGHTLRIRNQLWANIYPNSFLFKARKAPRKESLLSSAFY